MPLHSFIRGSALSFLFAAAAYAQNCVLTVPAEPLTATGLATPYTLSGCDQTNAAAEGCFVEAAIFDPTTNSISIYHPLVVNEGDVAGVNYITPVTPTLPSGAIVGIWFGSNAVTLTLSGPGASQCVNGFDGSIFGQIAYCNAEAFMKAAQAAITSGALVPPPIGTATNGDNVGQCLTTRDFRMVDMDQSDNVATIYLLTANGTLAQNTPANSAANPGAQDLSNASDNALLDYFLSPTFGCTPWMAPSITAASGMSPAQALNELMGFKYPQTTQNGGIALMPLNDPMTVITNNDGTITQSLGKVNAYRAGMGQPPAQSVTQASGITYCQNYAISGIFIANNQATMTGKTSPVPDVAVDLYTFMAQRFAASFGPVPALGCNDTFGIPNPVTLTVNSDCIVTAATINTEVLQQIFDGQIEPTGSGVASTTVSATITATSAGMTSTITSVASVVQSSIQSVNSAVVTQAWGRPGWGRHHYKREHARDVRMH